MKRRAACATALSAIVAGVLVVAGPASAAPSTQVVQGEVLRLVSIADWDAASSLLPGQPVQWDVTVPLVEMADTEVAHLRLVIALDGEDGGSTHVRVHARGAGESATIGPDGGLATAGGARFAPWVIGGALALVATGSALSSVRHRGATRPGECRS